MLARQLPRNRRSSRGKNKAIVAVGRSLLLIIWHHLAESDTRFHDLGADHYERHVNTHNAGRGDLARQRRYCRRAGEQRWLRCLNSLEQAERE